MVLIAALLWFWLPVGVAWGQAAAPALAHLVRPRPGTRPLGAVLAELSRQGQLPFSYSSSLVPVAHPCTLRPGPPRPLGALLRDVLAAEHLSYGLLNGQLVLWPNRVAAPAGVVAVNGQATPPTLPIPLPTPSRPTASRAAPAASQRVRATTPAADGPSVGQTGSRPGVAAPPTFGSISNSAKPARTTATSGQAAGKRPLRSGEEAIATARSKSNPVSRSGPQTQTIRPVSTTAQRVAATPHRAPAPAGQLRFSQSRAHPAGYRPSAARGVAAATSSPYPPRLHRAGRPPRGPGRAQVPLALLPPLPPVPLAASEPASALLAAPLPTVLGFASGQSPATRPVQAADSAARKFPVPAGLTRRFYLHGEAWGSETLPLSAAVKLGIPRLYAVLGAAVGPFDHPAGWAWGVGVGTVGRPRGRFTPSLDVLHWFLSAPGDDREAPHDQLTQLRPALAWQLRPGGRWQLVGGPTLNLATGRRSRAPFPWPLGEHQWLWVNSDDGPSLLRLWPGVQLGLRF